MSTGWPGRWHSKVQQRRTGQDKLVNDHGTVWLTGEVQTKKEWLKIDTSESNPELLTVTR